MQPQHLDNAAAGIGFVLAGMVGISVNDMLIKQLSGSYPLHQMVFLRSTIGIVFGFLPIWLEGGLSVLKTTRPGLQALRGGLIVIANMSFFAALAVLPLADATALFFAAPLFITLLSIPVLGERVGPMRWGAVIVGFGGVILMQRPWESGADPVANRIILLLPVLAALAYACNQVLTRKLGATSRASALSFYIQLTFIIVSALFWLVAGDGRFAADTDNPAVLFLLRAWVWPDPGDWAYLVALGLNSAVIGYCLSAAYRMADAATVAPFEYVGLPLAVFWGWTVFGDFPSWEVWTGMVLIAGSGLFVFLRERRKARVRGAADGGRITAPK